MRYVAIVASLAGTLVFGLLILASGWFIVPFAVCGVLAAIGIWDMVQTAHSLRRNYPILANLRFMLEKIRPEIRQYFLESDIDGTPFNRNKRAVVYQRAKGELDKRPFGTQQDIYASHFEWINHSLAPVPPTQHDFRIYVGGPDCKQPYSLSLLNISAMSFGSLSANAIRALNKGARLGNSRTTPARAATAAITRSSVATSSGRSAVAISAAAMATARSARRISAGRRPILRSR